MLEMLLFIGKVLLARLWPMAPRLSASCNWTLARYAKMVRDPHEICKTILLRLTADGHNLGKLSANPVLLPFQEVEILRDDDPGWHSPPCHVHSFHDIPDSMTKPASRQRVQEGKYPNHRSSWQVRGTLAGAVVPVSTQQFSLGISVRTALHAELWLGPTLSASQWVECCP